MIWYCERCNQPKVEERVGEVRLMLNMDIVCTGCHSINDALEVANNLELEVERMEHEGEEVPAMVQDSLQAVRQHLLKLKMEAREEEDRL